MVEFILLLILPLLFVWVFLLPKWFFIITTIVAIVRYFSFLDTILLVRGIKILKSDVVLSILLVYMLWLLLNKNNEFRKLLSVRHRQFFFLYLIWSLMCTLRGLPTYAHSAIGESRNFLPIITYFFCILCLQTKKDAQYVARWMFYGTIALLIIGLILFVSNPFQSIYSRGRIRIYSASDSLFVSFAFLGFIAFFLNNAIHKYKLFFLFLMFLFLFVVLISQNRSVWLSTAFTLALFGVIFWKSSWRFYAMIFPYILVLSLIFYILNATSNNIFIQSYGAMLTFLTDTSADYSANWRLIGWRQEWQVALQSPFIGHGYGGYYNWFVAGEWTDVMVHNGYLMLFSKQGLVGVILYLLGFSYFFRDACFFLRRTRNNISKAWLYAILAGIVAHLIYNITYCESYLFWILVGLGSVMINAPMGRRKHSSLYAKAIPVRRRV